MHNCHYNYSKNQPRKSTNDAENNCFVSEDFSGIFACHAKRAHSSNFADSLVQNHSVCVRHAYHNNQQDYNQNNGCNNMNDIQNRLNLRDFIIQSFNSIFYALPLIFRLFNINLFFNSLTNVCRICLHSKSTACNMDFRIYIFIFTDSCLNHICSLCLLVVVAQIN